MQEAVPIGEGSMIAVLGSKVDELKDLIKKVEINGVCEIANDKAEGQIIVRGNVASINSLQDLLKENKKKFIPLNVSAPFHCSLMRPAATIMKDKINSVNFKKPIFYFELKTTELFNSKYLKLLEPSKFPSTQRDLAFIVSEKLGYKELFEEISKCAGKDLIDIKLFDLFKGGELQKTKKSLAFRLTWQSSKKTLEDSYIDSAVEKITKSLKNKFGAKLRS